MKRKLSIAIGYLIIIALLLGYLSYSAYRIKIDAKIIMPQTYAMRAEYVLIETQDVYVGPGVDAYPITITVMNDDCKLDLAYTLEVETCGRLPLKFTTSEGAIATVGVTPCLTTSAVFLSTCGEPVVWYLSGGAVTINQHIITIEWDGVNADKSLCREVDKITIRPHIYAMPFKYKDLEELKIITYKY